MTWITTQPPIPYADVDALIRHIQASTERFIDGVVLATALKFVYGLALKKGELLCLTVGHVCDQNLSPLNAIRIRLPRQGPTVITVPNSFKQMISNYLPHIQNLYGADFNLNVSLFPDRTKRPYNDTSLQRHLDFFTGSLNMQRVNLEMIRKTGICQYYDDLHARHVILRVSEWEAPELAAKFARTGERHIIDLLEGNIKPAGDDSKRKAKAKAAKRIPVDRLTLRLKNNTMPSAAEIMEIIEQVYYFPTYKALGDFQTEVANAIQRNSALDESEITEITAYFRSKLYDLGFEVNLTYGKIQPLEYTLTDG